MAYRYTTPRSQQYQSTFVPLPLDYLNQAMQSRQQSYDQNLQNMMQAEDKYASIETSPLYAEEKNRLLDEQFGNIHKVVQDKYGGDYSQATNEIMRGVVNVRKNPLWNIANQDLLDWKQKKALRDQLEAQGQLEYAEGFDNVPIKDDKGNYILPKRQVYAKVDTDKMLQTDFAGRFTTTRDVNVPSDRYGQYKTKRVTGSTRDEMTEAITPQYAQEILRTNPQLVKSHPEYQNPEVFRQKLINDAMGRMPENEIYNYDRNLGVLTAGELADQEYRKQALQQKAEGTSNQLNLDLIQREGFLPYSDVNYKDLAKNELLQNQLDNNVKKFSKDYNIGIDDYKSLVNKRTELESKLKDIRSRKVKEDVRTPDDIRNEKQFQIELTKINNFENIIEEDFNKNKSTGIAKFDLTPMATSDPKLIPQIKNIREVLVDNFKSNLNSFIPSKGELSGSKLTNLNGFSFDTKGGFILDAVVEDEDGKEKNITLSMKQSALDITNDVYWNTLQYLANFSNTARAVYNKNIEAINAAQQKQ